MGATNFEQAGYVNITTSDGIVHGQVKQAGNFSFLRIYESGHEVPFYQPVVAFEMLQRVMEGLDIATGTVPVTADYITVGTPDSTYREGNSTVQLSVVPVNATYNTSTNEPNPPYKRDLEMGELMKRDMMKAKHASASARKRAARAAMPRSVRPVVRPQRGRH